MKTPSNKRAKRKYEMRIRMAQVPAIVGVSQAGRRVKVNFMVDVQLLKALNHYVPNGSKSDFVNGVLEQALVRFKREKAFQAMDELREKAKIRMSTEEFVRLKNYGRE